MIQVTNTCPTGVTYIVITRKKGSDRMSTRCKINKLRFRGKQSTLKSKKSRPNYTRKKEMVKRRTRARIAQVRNAGFEDATFFPWRDVGNVFLSRIRPNIGRQHARFEVAPNRSASLTQLVFPGRPGPTAWYRLIFFANSPSTTGVLQVSLLGTLHPGRVIPLLNIPTSRYQMFSITFPASALRGRSSFELEFRVNAGARIGILNLDTVVIVPV